MIIIYPTDTAYAIGCDARDRSAVKGVFEIKGRDQSKILPLIAADTKMVRQWCELDGQAKELADKYWPGPLTLVLPVKKHEIPRLCPVSRDSAPATSAGRRDDGYFLNGALSESVINDGCVAIRVPDSKEARDLSREIGAPIVSTSANKSGDKNSYSAEEARVSLGEAMKKVDRVIDAGPLPERGVSTMVKVCDNKIEIIRQGVIEIKV